MKTTILDLQATLEELTNSINRLTQQVNMLKNHRARVEFKLRRRQEAENSRRAGRRAKPKTI